VPSLPCRDFESEQLAFRHSSRSLLWKLSNDVANSAIEGELMLFCLGTGFRDYDEFVLLTVELEFHFVLVEDKLDI
jgi:hypothetical protein